jgi:hypothetical protein
VVVILADAVLLVEAVIVDAAGRATRLDPAWPPVLVAFVGVAVCALVVLTVVVVQRLRVDARRQARPRARGQGGAR